jgi:hypothetical protein
MSYNMVLFGLQKKKVSWQRPTLPGGRPPSTIGADSLNDRVRDVTGCTTVAPVTKRLNSHVKITNF